MDVVVVVVTSPFNNLFFSSPIREAILGFGKTSGRFELQIIVSMFAVSSLPLSPPFSLNFTSILFIDSRV